MLFGGGEPYPINLLEGSNLTASIIALSPRQPNNAPLNAELKIYLLYY